jgi:hypothetical protein
MNTEFAMFLIVPLCASDDRIDWGIVDRICNAFPGPKSKTLWEHLDDYE